MNTIHDSYKSMMGLGRDFYIFVLQPLSNNQNWRERVGGVEVVIIW